RGALFKTMETVVEEKPLSLATSRMVTIELFSMGVMQGPQRLVGEGERPSRRPARCRRYKVLALLVPAILGKIPDSLPDLACHFRRCWRTLQESASTVKNRNGDRRGGRGELVGVPWVCSGAGWRTGGGRRSRSGARVAGHAGAARVGRVFGSGEGSRSNLCARAGGDGAGRSRSRRA